MPIRVNDIIEFNCKQLIVTVTDLLYVQLENVHDVLSVASAFTGINSLVYKGKDYAEYNKLYRVELDRLSDGVCHVGLRRDENNNMESE